MPLYAMNFEMIEWIPNEMDKRLIKALFNFFVFMTLLSYMVASFSRPRAIPLLDPQQSESKNACVHCKNWKPARTHHCSICKVCVPKMDHHCPWLGNCVGYHNFKAFFLFALYQACTGMVYATQLVNYFVYSEDDA